MAIKIVPTREDEGYLADTAPNLNDLGQIPIPAVPFIPPTGAVRGLPSITAAFQPPEFENKFLFPEYRVNNPATTLLLANDFNAVLDQLRLIAALPSEVPVYLMHPEGKEEILHLIQSKFPEVKGVSLDPKVTCEPWLQDFTKHGVVSHLPEDVPMMGSENYEKSRRVIEEFSTPLRETPMFFDGGDVKLIECIRGQTVKTVALVGSNSQALNANYYELAEKSIPESLYKTSLEKAFGCPVEVIGPPKNASDGTFNLHRYLYHLDLYLIPLAPGCVGIIDPDRIELTKLYEQNKEEQLAFVSQAYTQVLKMCSVSEEKIQAVQKELKEREKGDFPEISHLQKFKFSQHTLEQLRAVEETIRLLSDKVTCEKIIQNIKADLSFARDQLKTLGMEIVDFYSTDQGIFQHKSPMNMVFLTSSCLLTPLYADMKGGIPNAYKKNLETLNKLGFSVGVFRQTTGLSSKAGGPHCVVNQELLPLRFTQKR